MSDISGPAASAAANKVGWHFLLGSIRTAVPVDSIATAVEVARIAADACDASSDLRAHLTASRVELTLQPDGGTVSTDGLDHAAVITAALIDSGHQPGIGDVRPTQLLEIAIDAIDIPRIEPFWAAVLDYVPIPEFPGNLIDPLREGPAVWFQQMDAPREQRNRIHFDITVPHEVAEARVAAALAAGGVLVSDDAARAFWVLADAEGNEICVCTWQDRD